MSVIDEVKKQKSFYRNKYRGTLTALIGALVLIMLLLAVNIVLLGREYNVYYATSTDGQIYPLKATEQPPPNAILPAS